MYCLVFYKTIKSISFLTIRSSTVYLIVICNEWDSHNYSDNFLLYPSTILSPIDVTGLHFHSFLKILVHFHIDTRVIPKAWLCQYIHRSSISYIHTQLLMMQFRSCLFLRSSRRNITPSLSKFSVSNHSLVSTY